MFFMVAFDRTDLNVAELFCQLDKLAPGWQFANQSYSERGTLVSNYNSGIPCHSDVVILLDDVDAYLLVKLTFRNIVYSGEAVWDYERRIGITDWNPHGWHRPGYVFVNED